MEDKVTLRDLMNAINRVDEKMDRKFEGLESRVRVMENFRSSAMGVIAVASAFFSVAATYIWNKVIGN